ncbi:MAG: MarR family transcriptional regulator [Candidatus Omnitrophica bacterium]|nr:MarR family transcriptional regulator [Candidatus Omnitrophota bacterium]
MTSLKAFGIEEDKGQYHEEIIYSFVLIYNIIMDDITAYLKSYHLTPGKLNILMVIKHKGRKQGISQVEISKHLIVTPSNMTKLIDKLEKEGLVNRSALEGDRRVNIMNITDQGSQLLDEIWPAYNKKLMDLAADLEQGQQKQMCQLLKIWLDKLQAR